MFIAIFFICFIASLLLAICRRTHICHHFLRQAEDIAWHLHALDEIAEKMKRIKSDFAKAENYKQQLRQVYQEGRISTEKYECEMHHVTRLVGDLQHEYLELRRLQMTMKENKITESLKYTRVPEYKSSGILKSTILGIFIWPFTIPKHFYTKFVAKIKNPAIDWSK